MPKLSHLLLLCACLPLAGCDPGDEPDDDLEHREAFVYKPGCGEHVGDPSAHQGDCEPAACASDDDCAGDHYCRQDDACGGPGVCEPLPQACDLIYAPVCGCDGETYANACAAHALAVSVAHAGTCAGACQSEADCGKGEFCQRDTCGGAGTCAEIPELCARNWDPVCGCDGETYANACMAHAEGINVAYDDPCGLSLY